MNDPNLGPLSSGQGGVSRPVNEASSDFVARDPSRPAGDWRYWLEPSRELIVFLAAATILSIIGVVAYWSAATDIAAAVKTGMAELLVLGPELQPEPGERRAFVIVVLAAPLVIGALAWALRARSGVERAGRVEALLLALMAVALVASLPDDPGRRFLLSGPFLAPRLLGLFVFALSLRALVWDMRAGPGERRMANRRAFAFISLAALGVVAASRIYGPANYALEPHNFGHLDPVLYSVAQIAFGATCLHDVLPQYGCYGEFLAPVLRVTGLSVRNLLLLMAILQAIAIVAIFMFARSLIRSPLLLVACGAWLIAVTNQFFWSKIAQPYLQYWPLRILFPALSLLLVQPWLLRAGAARAAGMGAFAGLALAWNLDSGVAVAGALAALVAMSGLERKGEWARSLKRNMGWLACFAGGLALSGAAFFLYLCWKAGAWIDLGQFTVFQRVFFITGFFMLPLPEAPDMWHVAVALALAAMVRVAMRACSGAVSLRDLRAGYLAVLALGVFSYFIGRSHPIVFILVSWPFVILLFHFLDRALSPRQSRPLRLAAGAIALYALVASVTLLAAHASLFAQISQRRWSEVMFGATPDPIGADAAFIRSVAPPEQTIAVLAANQAALLAESGRRSSLAGAGAHRDHPQVGCGAGHRRSGGARAGSPVSWQVAPDGARRPMGRPRLVAAKPSADQVRLCAGGLGALG